MTLWSLALVLSVPLLSFIIHLLGLRAGVFKKMSGQKSAVVSIFLASVAAFIGFALLEPKLEWMPVLYFIVLLPLLGHLYFQAFCLSETARRIRIMVLIRKGLFSLESLSQADPSEMVRIRLERLLQLDQVVKVENSYHAKNTILTFTAVFFRTYERILFPNGRRA